MIKFLFTAVLCLFAYNASAVIYEPNYVTVLDFEDLRLDYEHSGTYYYSDGPFGVQTTSQIANFDAPSPSVSGLRIDRVGTNVDLLSVDITPIASSVSGYPNVLITGYRYTSGLTQVAQASFWMGDAAQTYFFDATFKNINYYLFQVVDNNSSFSIDNLRIVSAIPLPPAMIMFGAGLLFLYRKSRRLNKY